MRKSNNYNKFLEYIAFGVGSNHGNAISTDNGVLECVAEAKVEDFEGYSRLFNCKYAKMAMDSNTWLKFKVVLVNEEVIEVYYVAELHETYIDTFVLDNYRTQKDVLTAVHQKVVEFFLNSDHFCKLEESSEIEDLDEHEETTEETETNTTHDIMKSEILKYAMSKIGTKRVSTLDGMTLEYKNKCYNIYVDDNNVTVEEIEDLDEYDEITAIEELERELDEIEEIEELDEIEDCNEYKEILDRKESTDRDRINYLMKTHSFPSITKMYNDKCFCCLADRKGNECKGKETCGKTWKRYEAINNPEWHHVSLATLANLHFDMLDRKRQVYLKAHSELKRTLADLSKCKTGHTYEARALKFFRDMKSKYYRNHISHEMRKYLDLQISMSNVINGVWSSYVEPAMGLHESRRYNRPTLTY